MPITFIIALSIALQTAPPAEDVAGPTDSQLDQAAVRIEAQMKAARAFRPLTEEFDNLQRSLQAMGGIGPNDAPIVSALRDKVRAFNAQWPDQPNGLALDLALSSWLNDSARVDELYARLAALRPGDVQLRLAWAKALRNDNRHLALRRVLEEAQPDPAAQPEAIKWLADWYLAEHRFDDALQALQRIPDDALAARKPLADEVTQMKESLPEYASLWQAEQALRQAELAADDLPRVQLDTSRGTIVLELFENQAPNTVANFITLVESGFYDQCKFHRVIPFFMAQGGDPNTKPGAVGIGGLGGPGYTIADEHGRDDHRLHFTGTLSMANSGQPNTGGSQFFMTVIPTAWLNGKHTVFGYVLEGMDVVRSIRADDELTKATVLRKREHEYVVTKMTPEPPAAPPEVPGTTITIPSSPAIPDSVPAPPPPPAPEPD